MRITITAGVGACNHLTVKDSATGDVLMVGTLAEFKQASKDDNPSPLLLEMRHVVIKLGPGATKAQAKAALEAEDFLS